MSNIIRKAKPGDTKVHNGRPMIAVMKPNGKIGWRYNDLKVKKQNDGGNQSNQTQQTQSTQNQPVQKQNPQPSTPKKKEEEKGGEKKVLEGAKLLDWAEGAKVEDLKAAVEKGARRDLRMVAYRELKKRNEDVTKLDTKGMKIPAKDYKKSPQSFIDVPEKYKITAGNGQIKQANRDAMIALLEKKNDADLLKTLNNKNVSPYTRHLDYEEATSRGIDEDKMDVSGTLEKHWKKIDRLNSDSKPQAVNDSEEEGIAYDAPLLEDFDEEEFRNEFPGGDSGWMDKNDKRVQEKFNKFRTLVDRQRYDQLLNKWKREDPDYQTAQEVVQDLNTDYLTFVATNQSPLFVSAGGAGAGKTYGFNVITEELNIPELAEGDDPSNSDWGFVKLGNPKSAKEFQEMLDKYNGTYWDDDLKDNMGHILVFDDQDDILTKKEFQPILKAICDTSPKNRKFKAPDGSMKTFTGKILVITNKSMDSLTDDEDKKAVMSRAEKSDIQFTVDENLDLLKDRYKDMGIEGLRMSPQQEEQAREFILDNKDKLDPAKFTVRKFGEVIKEIQKDLLRQSYGAKSATIAKITGKGRGWEAKALKTLNKAIDDDLNEEEKEGEEERTGKKKLDSKTKHAMDLIKKRNPKKFKELFGKKAMGVLNKEDKEDTAEKAIFDDMSLEQAENLLFG